MDGFRMPYPAMQVGTRWNCAKRECRYVDHLIDALLKLMATPDRVTGPIIGNQSKCSMLELAEMIVELTGSRSRTVYRPLPENDPRQRRPDISRAQELLSWAPRTRLKEGLIRTISYFEELVSEDGVRRAFALARPADSTPCTVLQRKWTVARPAKFAS
jgi:hypothetical protein